MSIVRPFGGRRKTLRLVGRRGDEERCQRIGRGLLWVIVLAHTRLVRRQCVEGPRVERRLFVVETSCRLCKQVGEEEVKKKNECG